VVFIKIASLQHNEKKPLDWGFFFTMTFLPGLFYYAFFIMLFLVCWAPGSMLARIQPFSKTNFKNQIKENKRRRF